MPLQILPLMMVFEMMDILFFVSCLKYPSSHFNILQFVTFTTSSTRSSGCGTLEHYLPKTNRERHFYFHRLPRLWNSIPVVNIQDSLKSIKRKLFLFYGTTSLVTSIKISLVPITLFVPAPVVMANLSVSIIIICSCY